MAMPSSRKTRDGLWQEKLSLARRAGEFLVRMVPGIKGVGLTGSVAYGDVKAGDDLDFIIIAKRRRVWTVRFFCYAWAWLTGHKRRPDNEKNKWCLNLFLAEDHLQVPKCKQSEFACWQVQNLRVLQDKGDVFARFFGENSYWCAPKDVSVYYNRQELDLPSGDNKVVPVSPQAGEKYKESVYYSRQKWWRLPGDWLEEILYRLQYAYMKNKITREFVSRDQIFFHPRERGALKLPPETL